MAATLFVFSLIVAATPARAFPHFSNPWRTVGLPARGYAAAVVPEPDGPGRRLLIVDNELTLHSFELRHDGALRLLNSEDLDASDQEWGLGSSGAPPTVMDVTGDDEPDLILVSYSSLLIAPGEGGGTYGEVRSYALPGYVFETPIDIDGDGLPDLVGGPSSGMLGGFTWRANRSGGAFGVLQSAAGTSGASPFAWRDLDGDGDIDALARSIRRDSVAVLRNDGTGHFASPEWQGLGPFRDVAGLYVGQFVGDDHPDLLRVLVEYVGTGGSFEFRRTFSVHRGLAGGRFEPLAEPGTATLELESSTLQIFDWNDDGRDDLVGIASDGIGALRVYLADGVGGFVPDPWRAAGPASGGLAKFDLDGDGIRDLVQVGSWGVILSLSGDRDAAPASQSSASVDWSGRPELVDLDGDGIRDLVGSQYNSSGPFPSGGYLVIAQPGRPDGGFDPPLEWVASPPEAYLLGTGDFDGDGDVDLLIADDAADSLQTWLNVGNFSWHAAHRSFSVPEDFEEFRLADIDGDGRDDLLASSFTQAGGIIVWRHLASEPVVTDTLLADEYLGAWTAGDVDDDGRAELVVAEVTAGFSRFDLVVYRMDASGGLQRVAVSPLPAGFGVRSLVLGSPDGSGDAGIFVEDEYSGQGPRHRLFRYRAGDSVLRSTGTIEPGRWFSEAQFGDVNGDGLSDVILGDGETARIVPIEPDGAPGSPIRAALGTGSWILAFDDRNADGKPDLVRVDHYDSRVTVHWNLMDDTPSRARLLAAASDWTVTLFWSDSPPGAAAAFQVERRRSGDTAWTTLADVPPIAAGDWTDVAVPEAGTWTYRLARRYGDSSIETLATTTVTVSPDPTRPRLLAPSPNPARGPVAFAYELTRPGPLVLEVFDAAGRLVRRIDAGLRPAERATLTWDLRGDSGDRVASGLYFARIAGGSEARRVVVLR